MGEIQKYQGSNLPEPLANGLAVVTIAASKRYTPWVFAGVGVLAEGALMGHIAHDQVPMIIQHMPLIGGAMTHGLEAVGNGIVGFDHLPLIAPALAAGAGFLTYKGVGKPIQRRAQGLVRRHGLSE